MEEALEQMNHNAKPRDSLATLNVTSNPALLMLCLSYAKVNTGLPYIYHRFTCYIYYGTVLKVFGDREALL